VKNTKIILESWAGKSEITEPILLELLNHEVMQRLKGISMGGCTKYVINGYKDNSRFQHSVNVLLLLRRYGAPLLEQIAGLLHDASHTVFSHVAENLFNHKCHKNSYQDDIHEWFLQERKIDVVLKKDNFLLDDVLHKTGANGGFKRLEQDLPDVCIDRLEYNIARALHVGFLSESEVHKLLHDLKFEDDKWFFTNINSAKTLSEMSLSFVENIWASAWNTVLYHFASQTLKRALDLNIINSDDIHFSQDDIVWKKLVESDDKQIKDMMAKMVNVRNHFEIVAVDFDLKLGCKFRGIDPLVLENNKLQRLTALDEKFCQKYTQAKERVLLGHKIKFK
jgi:hypothetical protein